MANDECNADDLSFAGGPCAPKNGVFWNCDGQTLLQQRLAAEYAELNGVPGEYYVNVDQFERQAPGPQGTDLNFDSLYMEPASPVRVDSEDRVEEVWNFRDPTSVPVIITERSSEREAGERGASKVTTYTLAIPVYSLLRGACAERLEGKDFSIGVMDIARVGDVIFLGGKHSIWLDVDDSGRRGYITPDKEHTWVEVTAVSRRKYVPSRKDELPLKEQNPPSNNADSAAETGLPYRPPQDHVNDPLSPWE